MKRYIIAMSCGLLLAAAAPATAGTSPRQKAAEVIDDLQDDIKALRAPKPDRARDTIDDLEDIEKTLTYLVKKGSKQLADVGVVAEKHTKRLGVDVAGERTKAITAAKKLAKAVEELRDHMDEQSKVDAKRREKNLEATWKKRIDDLKRKVATLVKVMGALDRAVVDARKKADKLHDKGAGPTNAIQKKLSAKHKTAASLDAEQLELLDDWEKANEEYKRLVEADAPKRQLEAKDAVLDKLDDELEDIAEELAKIDKQRAVLRKKLLRALRKIDAVAKGVVLWDRE